MRKVSGLVCPVFLLLLFSAPVAADPKVAIPGLQAAARIVRDSNGLPHIFAANDHDLFFLQGWVHAQDRLFQMDVTRRLASGTLAELLGPAALGSDVELRTIGLRRAAERSLLVLSPAARAVLEAYSAGVNAFIASHPLPAEYSLLELSQVEPWSPVDSLVIAKAIAFSLSFDLDINLTLTLLQYQGVGGAVGFDGTALFFEDLFRSAPFATASTLPDASQSAREENGESDIMARGGRAAPPKPGGSGGGELMARVRNATQQIRPETLALGRAYLKRVRDIPLFRGALPPRTRPNGSNEWAVSRRNSENHRPLLANDPHLALDMPATFYQVHLRSRRHFNVIGSGFPGTPFVILGHNRYIAWGATTNPMDVTDTFQEQVVPDPASPSGLSIVVLGALEPIIPLPQVFRYNSLGDSLLDNLATARPGGTVGGALIPPVVLIVPRRNQGPILALDPAAGTALSVQYTGFSGTRELEAFMVWNRARNLRDFVRGLQLFDFGSQNWAYADVWGNIAYFTSGEMPLREDLQAGTINGLPPFFIRNGTGGNEWLPVSSPQPGQAVPFEILPFGEMPKLINPPAGFFVNANNDPAGTTLDNNPLNQLRPGGGIFYLNPGYASIRAGRITQMIRERLESGHGEISPEDMKKMQADTVLLDAQVLVPFIVEAFENGDDSDAHPALQALAADPRLEEAVERLEEWDFTTPTGIPEGFDASDQDGQRFPPTDDEIESSVAATIYSVWRSQIIRRTIDTVVDSLGLPRPGSRQAMSALRHLLDTFGTNQGVGASGLNFFNVPGVADAATRRDILLLQSLADTLNLLAGDAFAAAFHHSTNQQDYRWGRLHRIVFDHPLDGPFNAPPAGGAFPPPLPDLPGIPTDGGFQVVDASSHSARAASTNAFMFGGGPVRRFVSEMGLGRVRAVSSLPGGASGVLGNPFYVNLLGAWLTNDTFRLLTRGGQIRRHAISVERFVPASP
ncbi:MAG: penicillin acylase family protein [Terriglobia bacterium]